MIGIKNIIFDLGGVILNINYQLTIDAFKKLGVDDFEDRYSQAKQSALFDDLETGRITPDAFRDGLRLILGKALPNQVLDEAWNALLLDFPKPRLDLLTHVKQNYRTFLLSNTNEIHYHAYNQQLQDQFNIPNLASFFEKEYYSHQMGMRKPNQEIFQKVLNDNNLNKNETLFIDDSLQHIESAKKLGIQTHWLKTDEDIVHLFRTTFNI